MTPTAAFDPAHPRPRAPSMTLPAIGVKEEARNPADATDAFLGYAFQGMFALLVLMDALDDETVSVESHDDVVKSGLGETLFQLKHSRTGTRPLSIRDDRFWKTIAIWSNHYRKNPGRY
ncbi:MAG: hypothetical protein IT357_08375, partial [Gemmatimonadaceae bacterium]|nr:hypothetical protein [Gemmatimonadaceae bacterium]